MMFIIGTGMAVAVTECGVQGPPGQRRARLGRRQRYGEQRVRAEPTLVVGAVEFDHTRVDRGNVVDSHAEQRVAQLTVDARTGTGHALAEIACRVLIAKLDRLA